LYLFITIGVLLLFLLIIFYITITA
jgi:hypothetical protein